MLEFPRIDDRPIGARHRDVTVAGRSADPAVRAGRVPNALHGTWLAAG